MTLPPLRYRCAHCGVLVEAADLTTNAEGVFGHYTEGDLREGLWHKSGFCGPLDAPRPTRHEAE